MAGGGAKRLGDLGGSDVGILSSDVAAGSEGDNSSLGDGGLCAEGSLSLPRTEALGLEELDAWPGEEEPWLLIAVSDMWSERKLVSIRSLEASFADTALIRFPEAARLDASW